MIVRLGLTSLPTRLSFFLTTTRGHVRPRSAYVFGYVDLWARFGSNVPGLVNLITQMPGLRTLAKWAAGMPQQRQVPKFATRTFRSWFTKRLVKTNGPPALLGRTPSTIISFLTRQSRDRSPEAAGFQKLFRAQSFAAEGRSTISGFWIALSACYWRHLMCSRPKIKQALRS